MCSHVSGGEDIGFHFTRAMGGTGKGLSQNGDKHIRLETNKKQLFILEKEAPTT